MIPSWNTFCTLYSNQTLFSINTICYRVINTSCREMKKHLMNWGQKEMSGCMMHEKCNWTVYKTWLSGLPSCIPMWGIAFCHKLSDGQHLRSLITFATSFTINIPSFFPPMLRDIKHSSFWQSNHKRVVIFAKDVEIMIDLWAIITWKDVFTFSWSSVLHFPSRYNSHPAQVKRKPLCLS